MDNSNNKSNKKAIMEVLCVEKATQNKSTFMWHQSGSVVELMQWFSITKLWCGVLVPFASQNIVEGYNKIGFHFINR